MKIKTISLERLKNLGNYESQRIGVTVELEDGENATQALARAKRS